MTVRRSRATWLAAMLAFLAVCVMGGLSGWHAAAFHDDEAPHAMPSGHGHADDATPDADKAIHLAAHAVGQGFAIPAETALIHRRPPVAMAWAAGAGVLRRGLDPASPLRPPQG